MKHLLKGAFVWLFGFCLVSCQGGSSASQGAALPVTSGPSSITSSQITSPSHASAANTSGPLLANSAPTPTITADGSQARASSAPVPITLIYTLSSTPAAQGLSTESKAHRRLQYISSSNAHLTITVTPLGGSATNYGPSACTSATCTVSFTATPGPNTLAFTLTDGTGTVLSTFNTMQIIQPSAPTTLNFSANPVVRSVSLQLTSATETAGVPANDLLTVNAQDADGNTIVETQPMSIPTAIRSR